MRYTLLCLFLLFNVINLQANTLQVIKNGPIHEAFVTQESGNIVLQAVPDTPPQPLTEEPPQSINANFVWIPGYWAWSREVGEYIWVGGVWRRPPVGHQWIPGRWKNYPQGWVWLRGFWSSVTESEILYISQPPPSAVDEQVVPPPHPSEEYFWIPGYWAWDAQEKEFRWLSGRWVEFSRRMQYVPGQYYWREKGYFFIPGFWDWTIDERGVVFADVWVPEEMRETTVYAPTEIIHPLLIMETLYPCWPNYYSLFRYHFYYYTDLWMAWGVYPPWWQWHSWWCLPVQDAWWLWWWWSHPGYPNPFWMDASIAAMIPPPSDLIFKLMNAVQPPLIATPNGVVGERDLIRAIERALGKATPILPSDPKQVEQIQDLADPRTPKPPYLRPTGSEKIQHSKKPATDSTGAFKLPPGRVKIPLLPDMEQTTGKQLPVPKKTEESIPFKSTPDKQTLETRSPAHTPSYAPKAYRMQYQQTPPPPFPPEQGNRPRYRYPQPPRQTQHLDYLMTQPQPQENPVGPKAHQYPGDESTLPYY